MGNLNTTRPLQRLLRHVIPSKHKTLQIVTHLRLGFAALFTNATALVLSSALPVQSFPQWVTIEGEEGGALIYDFNSLKSLPNGIKQIDTYYPDLKTGVVENISCPRWKRNIAGGKAWNIIPPNSMIETLAYKLCGGSRANSRPRLRPYPPCSDNILDCALKSF